MNISVYFQSFLVLLGAFYVFAMILDYEIFRVFYLLWFRNYVSSILLSTADAMKLIKLLRHLTFKVCNQERVFVVRIRVFRESMKI